ncbi:hypothetical protein HHK36_020306 [Tetracentron sinense]|uniref:UBC core domain-containing protein n=1 Tax=Tetracentron sinense TaxID=13715 RepID=A0A834YYS5_TETSI|nr:hypothetical protein HHK36_020306 [Tetracentron sinense]
MAVLSCLRAWCSWRSSSAEIRYATRRLRNEIEETKKYLPAHCSCGPVADDIFQWRGAIMGPADTPFEGGVFFISIHFPKNYPTRPPKLKFLTKVYHPNIDEDGTIHIDILKDNWAPCITIPFLLLSICSFLPDPNADDRLNPVSNLYQNERKRYEEKARAWTRKYAMD